MSKPPLLTPQSTDFPRWYQDVIARAELADNGVATNQISSPGSAARTEAERLCRRDELPARGPTEVLLRWSAGAW